MAGGIDVSQLLPFGKPEDVKDAVRKALDDAEGRIMIGSTTELHNEVPLENFLAMREAVRDAPVRLKVAGVKFPRPQNALAFLRAGADRIGTRAAPEIVDALDMLRSIGLVPS